MQQMNPRDSLHDQQEHDYSGYQAEQEYYHQRPIDQGSGVYPQSNMKIQPETSGRASAGQRLALAIVSVVLIAGMGIAIGTNTSASFGSYIALAITAITIFLINAFFNRWGVY